MVFKSRRKFFQLPHKLICCSFSASSHGTSSRLPVEREEDFLQKTGSDIGTEIDEDLKMQLTTIGLSNLKV